MNPSKTLIQFTLVHKKSKTQKPCWVKSVNYADGPGYKVKKVFFTEKIEEAAHFSLVAAHAIAEQYYTYPAFLVGPDGAVKVEESKKLRDAQLAKMSEAQKVRADIAIWEQEMAKIMMSDPTIRKAVTA